MTGQFPNALDLEDLDGKNWRVEENFSYRCAGGFTITVPRGYETDLASIPNGFSLLLPALGFFLLALFNAWWLLPFLIFLFIHFALPPTGFYDKPAVIHDYLYTTHLVTRARADKILLEAMVTAGVKPFERFIIYSAVRLVGWTHWRKSK